MRSAGNRTGRLIKMIFFLLILVVLAIALTPLSWYHQHVDQYMRPIALSNPSGSAVKGSADSLSYQSVPVGQAEWLLYPTSLKGFGGQLRVFKDQYDLTFELDKLNHKSAEIKAVKGYINWGLIEPLLNLRYGKLDGYAQMNLRQVQYDKATGLQRLDGQVRLMDFKLTSPRQKNLGEVIVDFETKQAGTVVGQFSSNSDVINVSGTMFLHTNRWELNLDIIPKGGHFEMDAILQGIGSPRRGGGRRLNLAGFY